MRKTWLRLQLSSTETLTKVKYQLHLTLCAVFNSIKEFDVNKDSKISFGEFVSSLWSLERRDDEQERALAGQSSINFNAEHSISEHAEEVKSNEESKQLTMPELDNYLLIQQQKYLKEFGAMLPVSYVHCMPAQNGIKFIK